METQLTDPKGRHCRRRLCCYYFKVNKLKDSFPVLRGDCPITFLELFRGIRIYAGRPAARGLHKRSCACTLYLVNGRAAAELLVWWQDRLRLCRCQGDHAQPNCQNHKRQQHYHFWHCVFRRIMPIKYNRYFPHSIVRRSSPPGVAHVAAVCRVPYRSAHESKRANRRRSDMAVMQRGALKAAAKAGAFLMRAAHLVAVLQAKRRPEPHAGIQMGRHRNSQVRAGRT